MRVLVTGGSGFIGTNLIEVLESHSISFLIVDKLTPKKEQWLPRWKRCDLSNYHEVERVFLDFRPTHVVHLAAITDTLHDNLEYYYWDNVIATENVIYACQKSKAVRLILTSTQFVIKPGKIISTDTDFDPHTAYGESKVRCEKLIREINPDFEWVIVRPTNIWGPYHPRYPQEFWSIAKKGLYIHPGVNKVIRSYGFVGNVTDQIYKLLNADSESVNKKVFYLGDTPLDIYDWANEFNLAFTKRNAPRVSTNFVKLLGIFGDILERFNLLFPITSSRYKSMTSDYPTPMDNTFNILGKERYSLKEGVEITIKWLKTEGWKV